MDRFNFRRPKFGSGLVLVWLESGLGQLQVKLDGVSFGTGQVKCGLDRFGLRVRVNFGLGEN